MTTIAVTGGIAVGKSVMMQYWQSRYAIPIFDTDDIGRSLLNQKEIKKEICHIFGGVVIQQNGMVNRALIQKKIFTCPHEKSALESLLHPLIRDESQRLISENLKKSPFCLVIVPLLYETNTAQNYDRVCVVESGLDQRVRRCFDRGLTETITLAVLQSQATSEQRLSISDDVLYNVKDYSFFYAQIDKLYDQYEKLFNHG